MPGPVGNPGQVCLSLSSLPCFSNGFAVWKKISYNHEMSLVVRKPVFGISDHVLYKPGCTAMEDGYRLEMLDLGSTCIGIVLSV